MLRSILSVIAGYVVMALAVIVIFSVAFIAIGPDRAYQPGTYLVSGLWLGIWAVGSIIAALIGGFVCAKIDKPAGKGPIALAAVVLILGTLSAIFTGARPDPGPRPAEVSTFEAASKSVQPIWTNWANIPIGIAGVLAGASLGRKKSSEH